MAAADQLLKVFKHGTNEVLDYTIDWGLQLAADADTIASSEWVAESGTPTIGDGSNGAPAPSFASGKTSVWLVGGTAGDVYLLSNRITTAGLRTLERSVQITVVDK